ncbi:anti-sigma regulatory factor (Ser/Thr protein kinase) [Actinomadura pelletieri DSM 43383]|uniref:Anti-sigma regulatory factor (Ser/Thr protein kinase) n=1 Tax=Actinomadura pelletieri DSM 43383 TaxID=1120940 RepID=A0A495QXA9_9ACTN|nr:anti-sigma regulatory factor (Ser/Thr protein kinase) [Actinomadura pelletieri DSM 43383]
MQSGQIGGAFTRDISMGGMCAWRLPSDERCASVARSLVRGGAGPLGLERDIVEDAVLAASELVTNALNHGLRSLGGAAPVPPELWVWARATPKPQLVVSVFDACRVFQPDTAPKSELDEHGKGLGIVSVLADSWGAHLSRSWAENAVQGKVVWCTFALPQPWPRRPIAAPPMATAGHLASTLRSRGLNVVEGYGRRVAVVSALVEARRELNVWIEPGHLSYNAGATRVRRPIVDLYDTAEDIVRWSEAARPQG